MTTPTRVSQLQSRQQTILELIAMAKNRNPVGINRTPEQLERQIPHWGRLAADVTHWRLILNHRFCGFLVSLGNHPEWIAAYIQAVEDARPGFGVDDEDIWNLSSIRYTLSVDQEERHERNRGSSGFFRSSGRITNRDIDERISDIPK